MSEKEFPSCAYDVCAEFDCEETMALALIATRNELERTRKALEITVDALKTIKYRNETYNRDDSPDCIDATLALDQIKALDQITTLEQKDVK